MLKFCRPSYIRLSLVSFKLVEMESRYLLLKSEGRGLLIPNSIPPGEVAKDQMADFLNSWNDCRGLIIACSEAEALKYGRGTK
jgi:hypothetical protein